MFSFDISPDTFVKAYNKLCSQCETCEVPPTVRITVYPDKKNYSDDINLVCNHADPSLNVGSSALGCQNCSKKEKVKEYGVIFNQLLYERFEHLNNLIKERDGNIKKGSDKRN